MKIRQITVKKFKNFLDKTIKLDKIVLFKGPNGSGKSTLALESLLFCLHGYTPLETLKDVPTRNQAKSCEVETDLTHDGKEYKIVRCYPTKLTIFEDNEKLVFTNSSEAQKWINATFGDRTYFQKFRIVDAYSKDANILEEGQTTLKKIIFSISEDTFNNIRKKLNDIKREREIFNKDKAVVYKIYPSMKRLNVICENLKKLESQRAEVMQTVRDWDNDLRTLEREMGMLEEQKKTKIRQRDKINSNTACYVCKQKVSENIQKGIITELNKQIENAEKSITEKNKDRTNVKEILASEKKVLDTFSPRILILNELKMKLQARLKLKDYKYTDRDVLIAKKAIEEVDILSTYYLTESVKILEPIMNDVLSKINFSIRFIVNEKNKFSISLYKDDTEFKYKDLSTGQKLLLQIAFKLALLLERGESGIIIADEGMGSLDEENLHHVLGIFENLPFQLFLVLHRFEEVPDNIKVINLNEEK